LKGREIHCQRRSYAGNRWLVGLALLALLLSAGGAGPIVALSVGASGLAPVGQAATMAASSSATWFRIRTDLSNSADVDSGYPGIATDSGGNYVAVAWTEGYDSSEEAKHHGRVYLRWISEDSGVWSPKISVDAGMPGADYWATDVAVAIEDTSPPTAHLVWVRYEETYGYSVWYRACRLDGSSCGSSSVYRLTGPTVQVLASTDIAVDSSGRLFAVWMRVIEARFKQAIDYAEKGGPDWSPAVEISQSNTFNDWPVVAVRGDTVYAAWVNSVVGEGKVMYRTKPVGGGWSGMDFVYIVSSSRYPDLVAEQGTVYLVWETLVSGSNYRVRYKADDGTGWEPAGTNVSKAITDTTSTYKATTSGVEYLEYLRPALALGADGVLHAVWHHYVPPAGEGDPALHRVLYSASDSPTAASPTWSEPVVFATLSAEGEAFSQDNVAARVAVGPPRGGEIDPHIHVILMLKTGTAWDVWYLSNKRYNTTSLPIIMKNR